jgi:hypothetical protein
MRDILANMLHVFVIFMIAIFIIGVFLAITGTFDHWNKRYILKRKKGLRRQNIKDSDIADEHFAPYAATKPDKNSIIYNK